MITKEMLKLVRDPEMRKLLEKKEELRGRLKHHFCQPVSQRDYKELGAVVDELDALRKRIHQLKTI